MSKLISLAADLSAFTPMTALAAVIVVVGVGAFLIIAVWAFSRLSPAKRRDVIALVQALHLIRRD